MKVLYVATEVSPFIKVGGLGDVAGSLPKELKKLGVDIRIAVPKYQTADFRGQKSERLSDFSMYFNWQKEKVRVYKAYLPGSLVPVYFFENERHLSGEEDYFVGRHKERIDRFIFFSKAVVEWLNSCHFHPDVIHINDWHPSTIATILKGNPGLCQECKKSKIVLTIHNHGSNEYATIGSLRHLLSYPNHEFPKIVHRRSGVINLLLNGILNSDFVNAVSPTYAKEIVHRKFCGRELADAFSDKEEEGRLIGILNGIDYSVFDPEKDKNLPVNFSVFDWKKGKAVCKKELLRECGLKEKGLPLLSFIARLSQQKGIDLLTKTLSEIHDGFQFVILGTGRPEVERVVREFMEKNKGAKEYAAFLRFDVALASLIYAGSDIFVVPSRFEPCGLTQMIAMKYGTVPIVRKTGGLSDTVFEGENGFVFSEFRVRSLERAIKRACKAYEDKILWERLVERCMKEDFSWEKSAKKYLEMYEKVMKQ